MLVDLKARAELEQDAQNIYESNKKYIKFSMRESKRL